MDKIIELTNLFTGATFHSATLLHHNFITFITTQFPVQQLGFSQRCFDSEKITAVINEQFISTINYKNKIRKKQSDKYTFMMLFLFPSDNLLNNNNKKTH